MQLDYSQNQPGLESGAEVFTGGGAKLRKLIASGLFT